MQKLHDEIKISAGLDIGSVQAKIIVCVPKSIKANIGVNNPITLLGTQTDYLIYGVKYLVLGEPIKIAAKLLNDLLDFCMANPFSVNLTGIHAKLISDILGLPFVNEFKAIARGAAELVPEAKTVLEIGGDGSRFIQMQHDSARRQLSIINYERNGDCAAGTGSFIDQQAARLRFAVEDISELVEQAENTANIAGRCSVFAKSDMVHAQQRGYSPAAIFKGLCEAVVRNYRGTVLRGKTLHPPVVFIGGVASNRGVVKALEEMLVLSDGQLVVPELHHYAAAIGCAVLDGSKPLDKSSLARLSINQQNKRKEGFKAQKLDRYLVHFADANTKSNLTGREKSDAYLGIDVGSVSTNLVLLDSTGGVIDEIYTRTDGRPVEVVQRELNVWKSKWGQWVNILGVGTTGSGREMVGELVGADTINDEITAHKTGANHIAQKSGGKPVDTIFEIGGQDAKFISIQDGVVVDFTMNEACAAGTGSFLEEQAAKMGIDIIDEFAELAFGSRSPVQMGERCTVFMEKDVSAYLQQGIEKRDIAAGLAFAVVQNYLNRVVRGRKIGDVIYFQGGTAYNHAVAAALAATLGKRIIVPPHCGVMGAIGAALLAKETIEKMPRQSRFYGFDLERGQFNVRHFSCKACSNQCDMQEVVVNNEKTYWGDKCSERYRKKRKTEQKAHIPDLVDFYRQQLVRDVPEPDGLGIKIGIPRTMYFFDRYPFWRSYFAELGAELVLSESTNRLTVSKGREYCISEPCFPIIASYGHVVDLLEKEADFVLVPNAINGETTFMQKESWYCPWVQTLPLVLRNTFYESPWSKRILAPIIRFRDGQDAVTSVLASVAKKLGVRPERHRRAAKMAFAIQEQFQQTIRETGRQILANLGSQGSDAIVILGRPYNIYDQGLNLNVPGKLWEHYGINVIPMDFLPCGNIDITGIHENMFWNYGRRILQAASFVGQHKNLHVIYITNFKCGPDSYIKHFVHSAIGAPFLTLQFDEHSNDAGILTRCEAYLESKNLLLKKVHSSTKSVQKMKQYADVC